MIVADPQEKALSSLPINLLHGKHSTVVQMEPCYLLRKYFFFFLYYYYFFSESPFLKFLFLVCPFRSPRPVIVEPTEQFDDEDGLSEKLLQKSAQYHKYVAVRIRHTKCFLFI